MKYRNHAGSLTDSMETEVLINNMDELKTHLNKYLEGFSKDTVGDIKFQYTMFDKRTGWDTYYVLVRLKGDKEFTIAGMSDGKF